MVRVKSTSVPWPKGHKDFKSQKVLRTKVKRCLMDMTGSLHSQSQVVVVACTGTNHLTVQHGWGKGT